MLPIGGPGGGAGGEGGQGGHGFAEGGLSYRCETPCPALNVIIRLGGYPDTVLRFRPKPSGVLHESVD